MTTTLGSVGIVPRRRRPLAVLGAYLGMLGLFAGIAFGYWHLAQDPEWQWPFLAAGYRAWWGWCQSKPAMSPTASGELVR